MLPIMSFQLGYRDVYRLDVRCRVKLEPGAFTKLEASRHYFWR